MNDSTTLDNDSATFEHDGTTLSYDGLAFDLALQGQTKRQAIIPKRPTLVPKMLSPTWIDHI